MPRNPKNPLPKKKFPSSIKPAKTTLRCSCVHSSRGAATALYDDQAVQSLDTLHEIDDDMIREMARAIRKPGDGIQGYSISELSISRLKLLAFWARHMWRTSRGVDDWTETAWDDISDLADQ